MNEKELRKLSRKDLLEILLSQTERIETLEKELTKAKKDLANKKIQIEESGTLAEASLKISGLFEKADESIEIFKNNYIDKITKEFDKEKTKKIKELDRICNKNKKESERLLKDAKEKADKIISDAKNDAEKLSKIIVNNNTKSKVTLSKINKQMKNAN